MNTEINNTNTNKKSYSLIKSLFIDFIIAVAVLCVFAYFHHVRKYTPQTPITMIVPPSETAAQNGYHSLAFYDKFEDKFTSGEIIETENSYRSPYVSFTITEMRDEEIGCTYYVADIYIATLDCLQSYFAENQYGENIKEKGLSMFENSGAVLCLNGDYYGARDYGPVIRNYTIYREKKAKNQDICLLYYNGVMETISGSDFSIQSAKKNGTYQCWAFGPSLLDKNGKAMTSFPSWYKNIQGRNPRSAIGYYEPGHYCFVAVDGRTSVSKGMTFAEESSIMESLGCKVAYGLDGGISSFMVYEGRYINVPPIEKFPDAPRAISDCIIIKDFATQGVSYETITE